MKAASDTLALRIGGPQGSGIDVAAGLFARACAIGGLHLIGRREYHSNIIGRHSYYDLRASSARVTTHSETPDMLVAFEAEALCRHVDGIADGGSVVCAGDSMDVSLSSLRFLGSRLKDEMCTALAESRLPESSAGLLARARERKVRIVAVPLAEWIRLLAERFTIARAGAARMTNTLLIAAASALLDLPRGHLLAALETTFPGRPDLAEMNMTAVDLAYGHVTTEGGGPASKLAVSQASADEGRMLVNACQSVALGKLAAGMGFQTYYPISPATDESQFLEANCEIERTGGGVAGPLVLQVEDELAALTMACGGALTGARCATATSGPGFSLMTEALGWAGMTETPVVVTLYQRAGPSTGMPTRTEQGDLRAAIHGGHGEFPRMVLASGDVEECFHDAMQAFDYAERYQLPVVHLLDKALSSTVQTVAPFDYRGRRVERGERSQVGAQRYALTETGISGRAALGEPGTAHWITGVEHGLDGHVSEDPVMRERMIEKRARKLEQAIVDIPREEKLRVYGIEDAAFTVLTWGSNKGAALEALGRLADEGVEARLVQLRLLWPFPSDELAALLVRAAPLIVMECNHTGQLASLLRAQTGLDADHLVLKYSGRPMSGESVHEALRDIHAGRGERRMVLRNPDE
jgi:2-oxoglutarate ferredoxin oxidoreductase subunit alpha